jgi:hypothetical protein
MSSLSGGRRDREGRFIQIFLSFNRHIKTLYGVNMNFLFDAEESRYITFPSHTNERSDYLKKMIKAANPLIVDGFACVGGDSIAFMGDFPTADLFAVQRVATGSEKERFTRLVHNISDFNTKHRMDVPSAVAVPCAVETFIPNMQQTIDLLYLDPPWEISEGREYDESSIMAYISDVVAGARVHVHFVLVKIRYGLTRMNCLPGFRFKKTIEVLNNRRLLYCFHVFQNNRPYPRNESVSYRDPWGNREARVNAGLCLN